MKSYKDLKSYCKKCRQSTNHKILFEKKIGENNEEFSWDEKYQVIECRGCQDLSFRKDYGDENMTFSDPDFTGMEYYRDVSIYPPQLRGHEMLKGLLYVPHRVQLVYKETIEALKVDSYILTAVGFRTIIESICYEVGIKGNLKEQIRKLCTSRLITAKEEKRLHGIRFLGNDSVHDMKPPKLEDLNDVLEIIEHLLRNLYIIDSMTSSSLDTSIDEYSEFEALLYRKAWKIEDGLELTLKDILGKDVRRIMENLNPFEQELIARINHSTSKFDALKIGKQEVGENGLVQYYVVDSPDFPF